MSNAMLGEWSAGPVPEPHAGVILLVFEPCGDPWAYIEGTDGGGRPDWVQPDGDPLGWSEFGADGCCEENERWMLLLRPDHCQSCGEEPARCACDQEGDPNTAKEAPSVVEAAKAEQQRDDDPDAPPYGELDRGIVELVRLFYEADFEPTDSGDGLTKLGGEMDGDDGCVLPFPHIVLMCKSSKLIDEVDRVFDILRERTSLHIDELDGWWVEGTYDRRWRSTILVRGPKGWWPDGVNIDGATWTALKPTKAAR